MSALLYLIQWTNIILVLASLIFLLVSTRKYKGIIGNALMYLSVGIIISELLSVADLLSKAVDFNTFQRIGGVSYEEVIRGGFAAFAFLMITLGFYKLSQIYKRI
jgi:hypothetical protein